MHTKPKLIHKNPRWYLECGSAQPSLFIFNQSSWKAVPALQCHRIIVKSVLQTNIVISHRAKDFTILIRGSDWERFYFLTAQAAQSVRNSLTDSLTLSLNFISGNSSILRYWNSKDMETSWAEQGHTRDFLFIRISYEFQLWIMNYKF